MTERFTNYRFNQNELQSAVLHTILASDVRPDPAPGMAELTVGQFWFAYKGNHLMIYMGEVGGDVRVPRIYAFTIGNGVYSSIEIQHNMHHYDVLEQVYEVAGGATVPNDGSVYTASRISEESVEFVFVSPPTLNQYRVMING